MPALIVGTSMANPLRLRILKMKLMGSLAMPEYGPHRLIAIFSLRVSFRDA
jgi:hypothetical protein